MYKKTTKGQPVSRKKSRKLALRKQLAKARLAKRRLEQQLTVSSYASPVTRQKAIDSDHQRQAEQITGATPFHLQKDSDGGRFLMEEVQQQQVVAQQPTIELVELVDNKTDENGQNFIRGERKMEKKTK